MTPSAAIVIGTIEANASFELLNVSVDDQLGENYLMYVQYDDAVPISLTIRNCIFRGIGSDRPVWLRDGGSSSQSDPLHTHRAAGRCAWALAVSADNKRCTGAGSIAVTGSPSTAYRCLVPAVAHNPGKEGPCGAPT